LNAWDIIILQPMINVLIVLSHYLFNSFGLTIIALTIITRGAMVPLTLKQLHATRAIQELQPKLAELQKKYGKDKQKMAQEQMRLYKESGVSPTGCMVPMLIQMPIWIALYQSIMLALAVTPEGLLNLSRYLYSWPMVYSMLPLGNDFLGMNLAAPNPLLAILVGGTMWVQQKMVTPVSADPKQQAQSRMTLWLMPLMFGFLCFSFPSGLALYWLVSNVISIGMQYFVTGWGGLARTTAGRQVGRDKKYKKRIAQVEQASSGEADIGADIVVADSAQEGGVDYGKLGDGRQDRGGGYPARLREIRRQPRRSKGHRPKRR
jgi:YidC/Oxa1 family membrane protein insertase